MALRDLAAAALAAAALSAGPAAAGEPLTLARAQEEGLSRNAEVREADAEVRAARARLAGDSVLLAENPELSAAVGPRDIPGERGTVDWEVGLSQRLELGGQRGARIAAARAALGAAEARAAAVRARIAADVRVLFVRIAAARLRAEVAAEARRLADEALAAAERRHRAGDVAAVDVTSARLERGRAARAAVEAERERADALAELELALAVEPGAVEDVAFRLDGPAGPAAPAVEELVREALAARREVSGARLDLAAAEAEERLAGRAALPAPAVGVSFAREERANVVLGTLSVDLPLFARNQGGRGVAAARSGQARAALEAAERRVAQEVRVAWGRLAAARRSLEALDPDTFAALGESLALVSRAYLAGQLDLVRYLLLRREALDARRERIDALEALGRAEADLDRAVGRAPGAAAPPQGGG